MDTEKMILIGIGVGTVALVGGCILLRKRDGDLGDIDTYLVTDDATIEKKTKKAEKSGPDRSQMLSWTSKVHAPSWSVPAVGTCPTVCGPIKRRLDASEDIDPDELADEIPSKCVGCYAFQAGKYGAPSVVKAQHRRWAWFDDTPDAEVVDMLVKTISEGGSETCSVNRAKKSTPWSKGRRKDKIKCKRDRDAKPRYFRLFDSGDFHNERSVRIWTEVARRLPGVRFWAPTTAWDKTRHPEIRAALDDLAALRNVAVKPSGYRLDEPAPRIKMGDEITSGSTVLSWEAERSKTSNCPWTKESNRDKTCERTLRVLFGATDKAGNTITYDPTDDTTYPRTAYVDGVKHAVCRGDCAKCRLCWNKDTRVAYLQHGPNVETDERSAERILSAADYLKTMFPQSSDVGPDGISEPRLPPQKLLEALKQMKDNAAS